MNTKRETFNRIEQLLNKLELTIETKDLNRPWGGFFVLDESDTEQFVRQFFPEEKMEDIKISEKLSPKILMVAPHKRLSWQFHKRRAELWRCIEGEVAVATSHTDEETDKHVLKVGDKIKLKQGQRHRLIGLDSWGVVAEIWQHTDAGNPSDEDDIVRLQDDFGRQDQ